MSDSETVHAIHELLSTSKRAISTELNFVVHVFEPLYRAIKMLQKESGGILDALGTFNAYVLWDLLFALFFKFQAEGDNQKTTEGMALCSQTSDEAYEC